MICRAAFQRARVGDYASLLTPDQTVCEKKIRKPPPSPPPGSIVQIEPCHRVARLTNTPPTHFPTVPHTTLHESGGQPPHLLITAGPTHEPIDAVRYIGNRSSGRLGIALAQEAARRGWITTLLLGPVSSTVPQPGADSRLSILRFLSCSDLQSLLREHVPKADVLVMAAAVADYRPRPNAMLSGGKFRRSNLPLNLELEPTPDLLAEVAASRRPEQLMVGFALEPRNDLVASARAKLERKRIDMVVGNPLETMDSETIEAVVFSSDGSESKTPGLITKAAFAPWLLTLIESRKPGLSHGTTPIPHSHGRKER